MILFALVALGLLLALALVAIGLRGRVVRRGQFCRRCRFDLAGIDLDDPGARCNECGRLVADAGARRMVLRARSRRPIAAGAVVLMLYGAVGAIVFSGAAPAVMASMPGGIVLWGAELGSDAALDELVLRLGRTPTLADSYRSRAIKHALALQADQSKAWDPRWGEVLAMAWVGGRLAPEQVRAYITNGQQAEVRIRDRVHADTRAVGVSATFTFDRMTAINPVQTGYRIERSITSTGINGVEVRSTGAMTRSQFDIPAGKFGGSTGMARSIPISDEIRAPLATGDRIEVFVEFTYTLTDQSSEPITRSDPVRFEQTLTIIADDEPIVRVVEDRAAAAEIIAGCEIEPILGIDPRARSEPQKNTHGEFAIYFTAPPKAIAGALYLRTVDGEELEATPLSLAPSSGTQGIGGMTIRASEDEPERLRLIEQIAAAGHADVIFRTDPTRAENNPDIDEVVDLEMIFRDVPFLRFASHDEMQQGRYARPRVPAEEIGDD